MSLTKVVINIGRSSCKVPHSLSPRFQRKAIPTQARQALRIPGGLRLPGFLDIRHTNVEKLSNIRTGRLYPPGDTPGTRFCLSMSQPQKRITSMKNPNILMGNRPRHLPTCSAVPRRTASSRMRIYCQVINK